MSGLMDRLEHDFGRVLGATPKPATPIPEPETVDCTDVQIGNSDIEDSSAQGDVRPEDVRPGTTPLPIYPTPADLTEIPS